MTLAKHPSIAVETAEPISPFDDPECLYVPLPETMRTFEPPVVGGWQQNPQVKQVLEQIAAGLSASQSGIESAIIDLSEYDLATRELLGQILGEGEISILADRAAEYFTVNEAVFTGVWRIKRYENSTLNRDYLEIGPCPTILAEWSAAQHEHPNFPEVFPENLMNAPALIYELFSKSKNYRLGSEEVINLTLLPLTPEDMAFLVACLGLCGLSILSKGYGDCRIRRTGLPNVWWVQYFNSPGQLILNTLEITAVPTLVMAAPEDLEDSAHRLTDVLNNHWGI